MMKKQDRIEIFNKRMVNQNPATCPNTAWQLLISVLTSVENEFAPKGEEKMTIPKLSDTTVKAYGNGGYEIPLRGYIVYLNANGAIQIKNLYSNGEVSVTLESANGNPFQKVDS